jgi:hypothetical protein
MQIFGINTGEVNAANWRFVRSNVVQERIAEFDAPVEFQILQTT